MDNTKSFWEAHKAVYDEAVKASDARPGRRAGAGVRHRQGVPPLPRRALREGQDAVQDPPGRVRRAPAPATGWYLEISARGVRVGGGFYDATGERLAAFRDAIADDKTGPQLERILAKLEKDGWEIGGDR